MADYQYCVATNTGKGFIEKGDCRRLKPESFPGNLWKIPANYKFSTMWMNKVSATSKTLAEAQSIVDAEITQKQLEYDAIPEDDPRKITNNILYKTRPGFITLEE
jgi:hypothetical protein|tara:strand:- start:411 stop:725 length:315 start_codon:yes stop_codon:yes gene_type:complete